MGTTMQQMTTNVTVAGPEPTLKKKGHNKVWDWFWDWSKGNQPLQP